MSYILSTETNPGQATWQQGSALGLPLAAGRVAASSAGPGNPIIINENAVTTSNVILITIESSSNAAAGCVTARTPGANFVVEPTTGFTGFVNYIIFGSSL